MSERTLIGPSKSWLGTKLRCSGNRQPMIGKVRGVFRKFWRFTRPNPPFLLGRKRYYVQRATPLTATGEKRRMRFWVIPCLCPITLRRLCVILSRLRLMALVTRWNWHSEPQWQFVRKMKLIWLLWEDKLARFLRLRQHNLVSLDDWLFWCR